MIKPVIISGFLAVLGIGAMFAPIGATAKAAGAHQSMHSPNQAAPSHPRRHNGRYIWFGSGYYGPYDYGPGGDVAPPPPPPVPEVRRECEPKTYTVPTVEGGESKVTVVRC